MSTKKREFEFDGKKYAVNKPNYKVMAESNKVYNKEFSVAIKSGAMVREALDEVLRGQGLWDDNKEQEYQTTRKEIMELELKIKKGGIKVSQGEKIARDIKSKRSDLVDLLTSRSSLNSHTAEGLADNMRFNYLVSACLVYNDTGKCYFSSLEDYQERADDPISEKAATELYYLLYDQNDSFEKELTENKFLVRFEFMNEKLEWVNTDGKLVDNSGRLIDTEGRFLDKEGNFVDIHGNPVTEDGDYVVDELPFLDEKGEPLKTKAN